MATLNNAVAYGFLKNVVRPIVIKSFIDSMENKKVVIPKLKNVYKPISVNVCNGKSTDKYSVILYYGGPTITLSLYNMMWTDNIVFIDKENKHVITVSTTKLRDNWSNILVHTKNYIDGSDVKSEMTYADINKVIDLASTIINLEDDVVEMYTKKFNNTFNNKKK